MEKCPTCGGKRTEDTTTFTVDFGSGVVVVRNVPAAVCQQCGEEWLDEKTSAHLEELVEEAKENKLQVEVLQYAA